MRRHPMLLPALLVTLGASLFAQPVFTDIFPPEEFAARRAKVIAQIGDGVAILQGATERPGEQPLRQNNQFFYLTGVIEPRAILVIDGKAKRSALYLYGGAERRERMFGSAMVLGNASASDASASARATKDDPWDGRPSREEVFIQKLKALSSQVNVQNLDPILDAMRAFKSPREIAVIREATRITGLAIMEAMREARPGLYEYELQAPAEFIFKKYGSQGAAYFALIATGRNTLYSHYHKNTAKLQDGDLVQFDYAPDYKYYVSDVTRVFPANGKFTPWQREFYMVYLRLYQSLMTSIKVHARPGDVIKEAVAKMDAVMADFKFADSKIKEAATCFVERYRVSKANSLGHTIGMEVHDVRLPTQTLEPGQLFTIEI